MNSYEVGQLGESWLSSFLESAGFSVFCPPGPGCGDLLVFGRGAASGGFTVEVKSAFPSFYRSGGRQGFQFTLEKMGKASMQADLLCLLCFGRVWAAPLAVFFVPAASVGGVRSITIPTLDVQKYAGRWSRWREDFSILAGLLGQVSEGG